MNVLEPAPDYAARVDVRTAALRDRFDALTRLTDPAARVAAQALLARVGGVDWEGEGYRGPQNQRDLSIKFHWGHDHDFGDGLAIRGRMERRHLRLLAEFAQGFALTEDHFRDRRVLDIGCWTGGTTLSLKMMGAAAVLAVEEVRKYAEATRILATDIYGFDDVTAIPVSLFDLDEAQGLFDGVYVPGVVYHLSDPVLGLRRLYNRLRDGGDILVESAGIVSDRPICEFRGNRRHHTGSEEGDLNRGGWNWFVPSVSCLGLWMEEAGFDQVRVFQSSVGRRVFGHGVRRGDRDITRAGLSVPAIP